jgi:hypothetical protein
LDKETGALHDNSGVLNEALRNHGTTENFKESGWVLPNGKMLKMGSGGRRQTDHNHVQISSEPGKHKVDQMLEAGAVGISSDPVMGGVIYTHGQRPVTSRQKGTLRQLIDHHNGHVYVAVGWGTAEEEKGYGHEAGTSTAHVFGTIARLQRGEEIRSEEPAT